MTTLVIAPHPDDEVLGCGGTIAKRVKDGHDVYVLIVSEGKEPDYSRRFVENERRETEAANRILGVKETIQMRYGSASLDRIPQKYLNDAIETVVRRLKPSEVFIPHSGDVHKDHQIVADASMVSLRPKNRMPAVRVLAYETISETGWNAPNGGNIFIPNVYIDISNTCISKLKAMAEYKSQIQIAPEARSIEAIEALARYRGTTVGVHYAEAFTLIREVER